MSCNPIVIGIGGATCAGKTTLCERIAESLRSVYVLSMDNYYWPATSSHLQHLAEYDNKFVNYDSTEAIDFKRLVRDLEGLIQGHYCANAQCGNIISDMQPNMKPVSSSPSVILVEGIFIYEYEPLQKYFVRRYFMTMSKEAVPSRRYSRNDRPEPETYFERYAWPRYLESLQNIQSTVTKGHNDENDDDDVIFLDGEKDLNLNYQRLISDISYLIGIRT